MRSSYIRERAKLTGRVKTVAQIRFAIWIAVRTNQVENGASTGAYMIVERVWNCDDVTMPLSTSASCSALTQYPLILEHKPSPLLFIAKGF